MNTLEAFSKVSDSEMKSSIDELELCGLKTGASVLRKIMQERVEIRDRLGEAQGIDYSEYYIET